MKLKEQARITALLAASALCAACAHQSLRKGPSTPASAADTSPANIAQAEPNVRDAAEIAIPELKVVRFNFDSDRLGPDAEKTLAANAAWLKQHGDVRIQVAGYCDERGTVEYNLALGQRRARAVRRYYRLMGIAGSRVATISYGKERPVCSQSTEACWAQNRRAETLEALAQNVSSSAAPPRTR